MYIALDWDCFFVGIVRLLLSCIMDYCFQGGLEVRALAGGYAHNERLGVFTQSLLDQRVNGTG